MSRYIESQQIVRFTCSRNSEILTSQGEKSTGAPPEDELPSQEVRVFFLPQFYPIFYFTTNMATPNVNNHIFGGYMSVL